MSMTNLTEPNSRWTPQPINLSKHINDSDFVSFTDTELKFGVAVAESHAQHKLRALMDHTSLFKMLGKAAVNMNSFQECYFN